MKSNGQTNIAKLVIINTFASQEKTRDRSLWLDNIHLDKRRNNYKKAKDD